MNTCYCYILASRDHQHLSVRATADLVYGIRHQRRRQSKRLGRRKVYQKLVFVESFAGRSAAIERERELALWGMAQLGQLISRHNPGWRPISVSGYAKQRLNAEKTQVYGSRLVF